MQKPFFDTKTLTLGEILGNGKKYSVPRFQRSYSWTEDNWEELWQDIIFLQEDKEKIHYLGSIVLQTEDNKNFTVIDGQQRLVTLSIIILSVLSHLDELIKKNNDSERNKERKEIFLNTCLGFKDPKSLTYSSKLKLNESDNDFYQSHLLQLRTPLNRSKLKDSNKLLLEAFGFFKEKIKDLGLSTGEELVSFVDGILLNKLVFIQIVVDDNISAYTVFETLNARGINLTSTDLLKNYLFSLVKSETDVENINTIWNQIISTIGYHNFPTFLRYYLNSQQKFVRSERIFKEIKIKISDERNVFDLIYNLETYTDLYVALSEPDNELWASDKEVSFILEELKLFCAKQHKSLLMACYFKMGSDEFLKVLRIIRAIVFKYNIIGNLNPNRLEETYNKAAIKVHKGEISTAKEILRELRNVYLDDEIFKNYFMTRSFDTKNSRERRLVRYILISIENQKFNKNYYVFDTEATIEHIYPENPTPEWQIDVAQHEKFVYQIGNLTLLESKLNNREASNRKFSEKISIYKKSQYKITQEVAESFSGWRKQQIKSRQRGLADLATSIWRVDY